MRLIFLLYALQVLCAVHAIRRGASYSVLFLILAFPGLGVAVYIIAVLLPEWRKSRAARAAGSTVRNSLDPDRQLRARAQKLEISDTVENRVKYADELAHTGDHSGAAKIYDGCLSGSFETDPSILLKSARAHFEAGNAALSVTRLTFFRAENPDYQSETAHLLYARALEAAGAYEDAVNEYEAVCGYFSGPEAKCWYGLMLQNFGHHREAIAIFSSVLQGAEQVPANLTSINKKWLAMAEKQLSQLRGG